MMQGKMNVLLLVFMCGLMAGSLWAEPLVSNIVGAQRAGTKLVDITYDLTDAVNATLVVTIQISKDAGATWDVPCTSVSGNGIDSEVTPGAGKSIVWDAGADWNGQWSDQMRVEITATAGAAPISGEYLVIDLSAGPEASTYPVSTLTEIPAGSWTDEYKTTKLVLHRIPAGTFIMGSPEGELGQFNKNETLHQVTLTQYLYVGVFEVTQKQWERVMGTLPSYFTNVTCRDTRPVEQVSYDDIRGSDAGSGWPANNAVDADSFMGRLRARTGLDFDLPTEAQWEYVARAGKTTALNSGKDLTDILICPNVSELGRYLHNGGQNSSSDVNVSGGTAKVGGYLPNHWGLYDTHGNVFEWCLDWWDSSDYLPVAISDPKGMDSASHRVKRGGCWNGQANWFRIADRYMSYPNSRENVIGLRVFCLAPAQR